MLRFLAIAALSLVTGLVVNLNSPDRHSASAQAPHYVLDHFMCYAAQGRMPNVQVGLQDAFDPGPEAYTVEQAWEFCNPTTKLHDRVETPITRPDDHLM